MSNSIRDTSLRDFSIMNLIEPSTDKKHQINNQNFPHKSPGNIWWTLNMHLINSDASWINIVSSSSLLTVSRTKKLLTRKPACHIRLLPIHLHTHMWVVYLRMFHVDIQLKAYMLSNFHQTSHQSTYKNNQTMSFSASCTLCQMFCDYSNASCYMLFGSKKKKVYL